VRCCGRVLRGRCLGGDDEGLGTPSAEGFLLAWGISSHAGVRDPQVDRSNQSRCRARAHSSIALGFAFLLPPSVQGHARPGSDAVDSKRRSHEVEKSDVCITKNDEQLGLAIYGTQPHNYA
jgi:hypothetical protein